jgi:type II secretory pathway pseudopilin PulG
LQPDQDRTSQPRGAFSIVEVSIAIAILGAAAIALSSGFSTGDGLVQAANETSWAMRLASQQADLVRRQLTIAGAGMPAEMNVGRPQRIVFEERRLPQGTRMSQRPGSLPPNLRVMGLTPIPTGSSFYLLNATNTTPPETLAHVVDGQMFRLVLYMTSVQVDPSSIAGVPIRDLGARKLVCAQVDVYRGIPGTAANDPTGGKFLFSQLFFARRFDLDAPTHTRYGPTNLGFIEPRP